MIRLILTGILLLSFSISYSKTNDILLIPFHSQIFINNNYSNDDIPSSFSPGLYFPSNRMIPNNLSYNYSTYLNSSINQLSISYSFNFLKPISIGFSRMVVSDIYITNSSWMDNGDGIPHYNEINYNSISNEKFTSSILSISSQHLGDSYLFGFGTKVLSQRLLDFNSIGISSDIGFNYFNKLFNFHIGVKNLFNYKKWNNNSIEYYSPIPFIGSRMHLSKFSLSLYYMYQKNYSSIILSTKYSINDKISFNILYNIMNNFVFNISFLNQYFEFSLGSKFYNNGFINDNINLSFGILLDKIKKLDIDLVP